MCSSELFLPRKRSVWTSLLRLKPWCFSLVAEHWLWHVTVLCGARVNATYWIVRQEITRPLALSDRSSGSVSQDSRSRLIGCISVWYPVFINVASSRCGLILDILVLGNCPTWRTNSFQCIYLFIVLYMFRACHAHHQEKNCINTASGNCHSVNKWII